MSQLHTYRKAAARRELRLETPSVLLKRDARHASDGDLLLGECAERGRTHACTTHHAPPHADSCGDSAMQPPAAALRSPRLRCHGAPPRAPRGREKEAAGCGLRAQALTLQKDFFELEAEYAVLRETDPTAAPATTVPASTVAAAACVPTQTGDDGSGGEQCQDWCTDEAGSPILVEQPGHFCDWCLCKACAVCANLASPRPPLGRSRPHALVRTALVRTARTRPA